MNGVDTDIYSFVLGAFVGVVTLLVILPESSTHRSLVERGAAYYHPTTGEFTWKSGNVILKEAGR